MRTKLYSYINPRIYFLAVFLCCACILGFGFYLEHARALEPCPLCILQRILYILIASIAFAASTHRARQGLLRSYNIIITLIASVGVMVAARQVWLQHLPPDQVPECGPGLEYMLSALPINDIIRLTLTGSGECAAVQWRFIGLSIAEWSLVCFTMITVASIYSALYLKPCK